LFFVLFLQVVDTHGDMEFTPFTRSPLYGAVLTLGLGGTDKVRAEDEFERIGALPETAIGVFTVR
jgi:hypothetical protein